MKKTIALRHRGPLVFLSEGRLSKHKGRAWFDSEEDAFSCPVRNISGLILDSTCTLDGSVMSILDRFQTPVVWTTKNHKHPTVWGPSKQEGNLLRLQVQMQDELEVGWKMLQRRFASGLEKPGEIHSWNQLRGIEGRAMRSIYQGMASNLSLDWKGRWDTPGLSQALTEANKLMYGMCEIAIRVAGWSPALGILHRGNPRSFVFDLVDLVKFKTSFVMAYTSALRSPSKIRYDVIHKVYQKNSGEWYRLIFDELAWLASLKM